MEMRSLLQSLSSSPTSLLASVCVGGSFICRAPDRSWLLFNNSRRIFFFFFFPPRWSGRLFESGMFLTFLRRGCRWSSGDVWTCLGGVKSQGSDVSRRDGVLAQVRWVCTKPFRCAVKKLCGFSDLVSVGWVACWLLSALRSIRVLLIRLLLDTMFILFIHVFIILFKVITRHSVWNDPNKNSAESCVISIPCSPCQIIWWSSYGRSTAVTKTTTFCSRRRGRAIRRSTCCINEGFSKWTCFCLRFVIAAYVFVAVPSVFRNAVPSFYWWDSRWGCMNAAMTEVFNQSVQDFAYLFIFYCCGQKCWGRVVLFSPSPCL